MQTIWHDETGRVQAVYDGDTTSTVWADRGYSKATSDPREHGSLSRDHVVTVSSGEVTGATYDPLPLTAEQWTGRIAATRYSHETKGTTFVHSDGNTYGVATDRQSQAMVTGAKVSLDGTTDTVQWKTAQGFVTVDAADMDALAKAVRTHVQSCFDREAELVAKVADGSITEADIETDWP